MRSGRFWTAGAAALAAAGLAAGGITAGGARAQDSEAAARLPRELARLPADPRPGGFLEDRGASQAWIYLEALDGEAGFGRGRAEAGGRAVLFRLLPYTSYWRLGSPAAPPEEYRAGDRLLVRLAPAPGRPASAGLYALEVRDEISEQVRLGHSYRMAGQDADNYTFTVEELDEKGQARPERRTLEYGRGTVLVLREDPVYTFRVPAGTRLWINSAARPGGEVPIAREVLDEASAARFRSQQRLRALARAEVRGARGILAAAGAGGTRVRLFPDHAEWARRLAAGEEAFLRAPGAAGDGGSPAAITAASAGPEGVFVSLAGPAAGLKAGSPVVLLPARKGVSYQRDIREMLDVNCLACHRDGNAQSGYSMSTPEKTRAGGRRGVALVPGKSMESLLYLTMSGDRNPRMPPDRDHIPEELQLLKAWIDAGATIDEAKQSR